MSPASAIQDVDLLVLVDNSNSMREEQANLTANLPNLVRALVDPPDEDGDGRTDWPVVASLHVGVITSDMGTSGYPVITCEDAGRGDDGVLQTLPSPGVVGCETWYPLFLTYDAESPDPDIAKSFECIATLGTGGCGFEQPLAAVEKALTVHAQPGGRNVGFLRDDALLAILVMTDEDDQSVSDPAIFGDDESLGPLNLRSFNNPEMLVPVDDLVGSISRVQGGHADRIVVALIAGVPADLVALDAADYARGDLQPTPELFDLLNDPRMVEIVDESEARGNSLLPACSTPGIGTAFPARRLVEFVAGMEMAGSSGVVQSVCQEDWTPAMRAITSLVQQELRTPQCLSQPLVGARGAPYEAGEPVDCVVTETRTDDGPCEGAASIDRGASGGRRTCEICQVGDGARVVDAFGVDVSTCPEGSGWRYDPDSPWCGAGELVFTTDARPATESAVEIRCACEVESM